MALEIKIPAMGEGIIEATIIRWLVNEGKQVKKDEPLVEIATDKVDSEIMAPSDGIIENIVAEEGAVVKVGGTICLLSSSNEEASKPSNPIKSTSVENKKKAEPKKQVPHPVLVDEGTDSSGRKFISPFVRNLAIREGIPMNILESLEGTGLNGRLTKDDILAMIENGNHFGNGHESAVKEKKQSQKTISESQPESGIQTESDNNIEIRELDRMRKLIAQNMVKSKQISPHVSSFVEVNVSRIVNWRNAVKDEFQKKYNEKLTYLPIIIEAAAKALKDFPTVNASFVNETLHVKKQINIGIATALDNGNLVVPVIKNAGELNLPGIAKSLNDVTKRAKNSTLLPTDIQGGTFTITNIGTFGNIGGTPIINQPELAILAVGTIVKKPVAVYSNNQYGVAIQDVVQLWLSYDHRIIDGFLGGSFLKRIADYLDQFDEQKII